MAREFHQREDLLRDATALVPRVQLRLMYQGEPLEVFAGFRGEALSLYFGEDPVYHFNATGELRRAFIDDRLIKAEHGKLVAWTPDRNAQRTDMLRHDVSAGEQAELCSKLLRWLDWLRGELSETRYKLAGQVPEDTDAVARLASRLADFGDVRIANSPRVAE